MLISTRSAAQDKNPVFETDDCIICHIQIEMMPADFHQNDIHLQEGLSCAGCHGGDPSTDDPELAMDRERGFVGVPSRQETPEFCGKCHSSIEVMRKFRPRIATDQVEQYFTSIHGQKLKQGDKKVAECVACHTAHSIMSANDGRASTHPLNVPGTCKTCHSDPEYMKEYDIPTDQFENFTVSVHGTALLDNKDTGSPACNDCHGNHGATPPGLESVSHICGTCHANNLNYFSSSPMEKAFREMEIHACEQCHGYHEVIPTSDEMISVGEKSVCTTCHSEGDVGYTAAVEIHKDLTDFVQKYNEAEKKLQEIKKKGMDDVDILFALQEANQTLIHTRTLVHTFDPLQVEEKAEEGKEKAIEAINLARQEIEDFYIRRYGFGFATIFITIFVVALYFKVRSLD